jgi:hypothetical protein
MTVAKLGQPVAGGVVVSTCPTCQANQQMPAQTMATQSPAATSSADGSNPEQTIIQTGAVVAESDPGVNYPAPEEPQMEEPTPHRHKSGYDRGESPPARKSYVDITASSCFAHAEDYTWLRGEVEYSKISNGWRLRYASVDETDMHGGSAILNGELAGLKDGMHVLVRGELHEANGLRTCPSFRVDSLEIVEHKD